MRRLQGRHALVTGAATGIGRATAELFAQHGARVVAFGFGGSLLDELAGAVGGRAVHGDVTRQADIDAALRACDGRVDIVVNAAGIITPDRPETIADDVWAKTFAVNVTGTMMVCRAAFPLLQRRGGAVVNVASVAAFNASPDSASYAASKAAVVSYTRSLAYTGGPYGVRANAVAPGWVRTPMSEYEMQLAADKNNTTPEAEFAATAKRIALGRMAQPAEIAACCLFLASDDASFITGATLVADGGGRAPVRSRAV
jgi:NAD(P)-dependent dehydrogenase (short-subunit alcohol dehydrogenase family)